MTKTILCRTCVKYRPADTCMVRLNTQGHKQARCKACVENVKKAKKL